MIGVCNDSKPVWEAIVRKHGLQPLPYAQVSSWPFADAVLRLMEFDNMMSTIKVRRAGFHDCIDTEEMFKRFLRQTPQRPSYSITTKLGILFTASGRQAEASFDGIADGARCQMCHQAVLPKWE